MLMIVVVPRINWDLEILQESVDPAVDLFRE
jgi:hypothetical protein